MRRLLARTMVLLCALLTLVACAGAPSDRGAVALEASLLAPCCYNGTLVTHESDLARTLRAEIEGRVAKGEATDAIRADMVNRYGSKVLAMPSEKRFGAFASIAALVALALTLLAVLRVRSWLQRPAQKEPAAERSSRRAATIEKDAYDDRIDAELDTLD